MDYLLPIDSQIRGWDTDYVYHPDGLHPDRRSEYDILAVPMQII